MDTIMDVFGRECSLLSAGQADAARAYLLGTLAYAVEAGHDREWVIARIPQAVGYGRMQS